MCLPWEAGRALLINGVLRTIVRISAQAKHVMVNIPVSRKFQLTWFSCGPACLQMLLAHAGVKISHWEAIRVLGAFPNGTDMDTFRQVYRRYTGRILAPITYRGVKRALNRGFPVLAVDSASSPFDHVMSYEGTTKRDSSSMIPPSSYGVKGCLG